MGCDEGAGLAGGGQRHKFNSVLVRGVAEDLIMPARVDANMAASQTSVEIFYHRTYLGHLGEWMNHGLTRA
ncbi:hypothetical protein Bra3105_13475 [Brachybacterium halotolerans subsp. kimchii]|uniref:hypothetical protein n=1 Tax=Brachybacterium halotolerans TaxID=2795215 RepID=UPI001E5E853D|nr:hypothetical protein [Brachybacterium halotolerans]UEJ81849.1 hypothetical protein Bra3105_13475 [Brachybacterium halotolerans subsp. kimchii]